MGAGYAGEMTSGPPPYGSGICERLCGEPACAEGGLEVVAADPAVEIKDFSGEEETGDELTHQSAGIDFIECDPSGGDFGFFEATGSRHGEQGVL